MVRMGVDPTSITDADVSEEATLAYRLRSQLEACAAEVILATPRNELTGWQLLDDAAITEMEDGSVKLPLPDDFLLLYCLRLKGWEREVTEFHTPDSPIGRLQGNRQLGLRGTAQRPVAVVFPDGDGRCLRLYGVHTQPPQLADGWYMPAPRIQDDDTIDIPNPEALIRQLILLMS